MNKNDRSEVCTVLDHLIWPDSNKIPANTVYLCNLHGSISYYSIN